MKRITLLLMVMALLLPTAATFAQDSPPPPNNRCDLERFVEDITFMVSNIQSPDDINRIVEFGIMRVDMCGEEWLGLLLMALSSTNPGMMLPPLDDGMSEMPLPPPPVREDDGMMEEEAETEAETVEEMSDELTSAKVERAIRAALEGDPEALSAMLCEEDRGTVAMFTTPLGEIETIESTTCMLSGDEMTCSFTLALEGRDDSYFRQITYGVEDEMLCGFISTSGEE